MNINHNDLYEGEPCPTLGSPELIMQPNKIDNATLQALIAAALVGINSQHIMPPRHYSSPPVFTKPTGKPKTATVLAKKKAKTASKSKRINRKK